MKVWNEPRRIHVSAAFEDAVGGHRLVAEELIRRGFTDVDRARRFLNPELYRPASPNELPDMDKAVERIKRAIQRRQKILVWGDFDVDGQTSTSLFVSALKDLGADVVYHIPNRFTEGHGIHLRTLKRLLSEQVDMVLTCDTGITAHDAVEYAQGSGIDVVITDHHALPDTLPDAFAAVNPMRLAEGHPLRELSGVGVAYKVMQAIYGNTPADHLLDLVAIGLIADVMVLKDDTRYLVQRGLEVLRHTDRTGLRVMMDRAEIDPSTVNEEHIGFVLAPQLNAAGRLHDANICVELLTSSDLQRVTVLANTLEGYNAERKLLSNQVYMGAKDLIEREPALLDFAALVLAHGGWHTGVVGIVASRLAEAYNRPVVMLSLEADTASGSARSIAGCDITRAIKEHAHMLNRFGGHTMAAGLSLSKDNVAGFRRALSVSVREQLKGVDLTPQIDIDAYLNFEDLSLDLTREIARLAPFGNGNPPLTLATKNLHIRSRRYIGRRQEHLELNLEDANEKTQRVLWWRGGDETLPTGRFDLAYTLRENEFRGERQLVVEWLDARPAEGEKPPEIISGPRFYVDDYRQSIHPADTLSAVLTKHPDALVWCEGAKLNGINTVNRYEIRPNDTLVVWSTPPNSDIWDFVLDAVSPQRLILYGQDTAADTEREFLGLVAGMAKSVLNQRDGVFDIERAAAAAGHRALTIRTGMRWLAAKGQITILNETTAGIHIERGGTPSEDAVKQEEFLKNALKDTRKYRDLWRKLPFESR